MTVVVVVVAFVVARVPGTPFSTKTILLSTGILYMVPDVSTTLGTFTSCGNLYMVDDILAVFLS